MAQSSQKSVLERSTIVDTDVHLSVPLEALAEYADPPHSGYLRSDSVQLKSPGWDPSLSGKIEERELFDPEQIETELRGELKVDHPLLNSFINISRLNRTDTAVNLQKACNDLLLDRFLDDHDYYGLASVATQAPDKAAEEIDRMGNEDQVVGVFLPSTGPNPPLGDPEYDPLYKAAADNDLPVVYHGATNSGFDVEFPRQSQSFRKFVTAHVNAHLWSQTMTLSSTLVNGLPEKFPDLDFVFLESGIGWVPYMMYRLNKEFAMRQSEVPLIEKQPEEYIRDCYYFASQPVGEPMNSQHMQSLIDLLGADSLLFASDYPHWDFDHPSELDSHLQKRFDDEERRKVLHENAEEIFDLDL